MFSPEKHVKILRWVLGSICAALTLAWLMAWLAAGGVVGLWAGIPCLAFWGYLIFRWARRKWLVRKLIKSIGATTRR